MVFLDLYLISQFLFISLYFLFRDQLTKQAIWRFSELSQSTANLGLGSIKAKFDLANGPSNPSSVYVQFSSHDTILSGLEFELIGSGYRLSLVKRQFSSGTTKS